VTNYYLDASALVKRYVELPLRFFLLMIV